MVCYRDEGEHCTGPSLFYLLSQTSQSLGESTTRDVSDIFCLIWWSKIINAFQLVFRVGFSGVFIAYFQHIKIQIPLLINTCTGRCLYFLCSKENMIRNLIAPYEGRSWAQTNWILVRIWKVWNYDFFYSKWYFWSLVVFCFCLEMIWKINFQRNWATCIKNISCLYSVGLDKAHQ